MAIVLSRNPRVKSSLIRSSRRARLQENRRVGGHAGAVPALRTSGDLGADAGVLIDEDDFSCAHAGVDEAVEATCPVPEPEDMVEAGAHADRCGLPGRRIDLR